MIEVSDRIRSGWLMAMVCAIIPPMQQATRSALEVAMPVPDDKAAVIETLREYYAASNKHDGPAMVSYYSEPVMRSRWLGR